MVGWWNAFPEKGYLSFHVMFWEASLDIFIVHLNQLAGYRCPVVLYDLALF